MYREVCDVERKIVREVFRQQGCEALASKSRGHGSTPVIKGVYNVKTISTVKEIRQWLETLDDNQLVAFDHGNSCLVVLRRGTTYFGDEVTHFVDFFEIGGVPVLENNG
jgi:hypothetical protein